MSNNVLQKIIDKKKLKLEKIKNEISLESIKTIHGLKILKNFIKN